MRLPDNEGFTPEFAASAPLDSTQFTGRGSERFSWRRKLLVMGGTSVFLIIGSAVGMGIGMGVAGVLTGIPLEALASTSVSSCDFDCQYTFAFGEILGAAAGVFGAALASSKLATILDS